MKPSNSGKRFKIRNLDELVLVVQDLEASQRFYNGILGLKLVRLVPGKAVWVAAGEQLIGLFLPGVLKFGAEHCKGPIHFAMSVEKSELQSAQEHLAKNGVATEGPVIHPHGDVSIYFDDPDKNRLELHLWGHHRKYSKTRHFSLRPAEPWPHSL